MKVLCVVSSGTGHLDFGGMGFVGLAKKLVARGHDVTWISCQQQVNRLRAFDFNVEQQPVIDALNLNYFIPVNAIAQHGDKYQWLLQQIQYFHTLIASRKPNLILFDRLLTYAALAADELCVPYASVGTPGGHWFRHETGTLPSESPVLDYSHLGDAIKNDLGWKRGALNSFWINSPLLNICFLGRDFYSVQPGTPSAQVYHFADKSIRTSGTRFGISFGNEGTEAILKLFMECMLQHDEVQDPLDIFLGNKDHLMREMVPRYQSERVKFHGWVDFSEHFPKLKCLAFFGGIGTIWHCIDNFLPMLVVPGLIGDQIYNGRLVVECGLGECFDVSRNTCESLRPILARISDANNYQKKIAALRSIDNYSDTMDTICEKLELL